MSEEQLDFALDETLLNNSSKKENSTNDVDRNDYSFDDMMDESTMLLQENINNKSFIGEDLVEDNNHNYDIYELII